jgi:hypothetical protein
MIACTASLAKPRPQQARAKIMPNSLPCLADDAALVQGDEVIGLARGDSGDGPLHPSFCLCHVSMRRRRPVPHGLRVAQDRMKRRRIAGAKSPQRQTAGGYDLPAVCVRDRGVGNRHMNLHGRRAR